MSTRFFSSEFRFCSLKIHDDIIHGSLPSSFEDLASDASIEAFAKNMETKYAQLDVLVNNAAIAFKAQDSNAHLQGYLNLYMACPSDPSG